MKWAVMNSLFVNCPAMNCGVDGVVGLKVIFLPSCASKKQFSKNFQKTVKTEKQRLRLLGPVRADHCRCRDVIKEKAQIILPRCSVEDLHRAFSRSGLFFIFFLLML